MVDAATAEARLRDHERLPLTAQHVIGRDADIGVADVAVAGAVRRLGPHADVADDLDARGLGRNDEQRHLVVGARLGVGHGHDDEERGVLGVGGKPLLTVDHPVVAVPGRGGDELSRVGATLRFGHRIARGDLAAEQRLQVAGLLLVGAEHRQNLGVARIRRLATEHRRRPAGTAEDLVEQRELDLAEALATELRAQMRGPQPLILHLLLQRPQNRHHLGVLLVIWVEGDEIEGFKLVPHELFDPVELCLIFRVCFEIPHGGHPFPGAAPRRTRR